MFRRAGCEHGESRAAGNGTSCSFRRSFNIVSIFQRFSDINNAYSICDDCIVCLAETYTFRKRCIENNAAMMGLIERLQSAGLDVMQIKARIVRSMKHGKPTALTCKNVARFNEAIAKGKRSRARRAKSLLRLFQPVRSLRKASRNAARCRAGKPERMRKRTIIASM